MGPQFSLDRASRTIDGKCCNFTRSLAGNIAPFWLPYNRMSLNLMVQKSISKTGMLALWEGFG